MTDRTCSLDDCDRKHLARGWCNKHYLRWRIHGSPTYVERVWGDPVAALWAKVDVGDCWEFIGTRSGGYGLIWNGSRMVGAHRLAWEALIGPIPVDRELDHLCRNRYCVNPDHLELVTHEENMRRAPCNIKRVRAAEKHRYAKQRRMNRG